MQYENTLAVIPNIAPGFIICRNLVMTKQTMGYKEFAIALGLIGEDDNWSDVRHWVNNDIVGW